MILVIGFDPKRDLTELNRLGITELSLAYLQQKLVPSYEAAGFLVESADVLSPSEWPGLESSWAKKLRGGINRKLIHLRARAITS